MAKGSAVQRIAVLVAAALLARFCWRWFTGAELDGVPRTDATWFLAAESPLDGRRRVSRWSTRPRAVRAAVRTLGTAAAGLVLAVHWTGHDRVLVAGLVLAGVAGLSWTTWTLRRRLSRWRHFRRVVIPLHKALGNLLGISVSWRPEDWLDVPEDYVRDPDARVQVILPDVFSGTSEAKAQVTEVATAKLGEEWDSSFRTVGKPVLTLKKAPQPPAVVRFAELRPALEAAKESEIVLGIGSRDAVAKVDLDMESPHIALSMGTGGGKSTIGKLVAAQVLHRGGRVVILDGKRNSHRWAKGLDGVQYFRDTAEIHNALLRLGAENDGRMRIADDVDDPEFQRVLVIFEEMNMVTARLAQYWAEIRGKDDPKVSPALLAHADIAFTGRSARMHLLDIAQKLTARTFGLPAGEPRENFGAFILGRYSLQSWRMLVPEIWPAPKKSTHLGRVQLVISGTARAVQIGYLEDQEAIQWAASGLPQPRPAAPDVTVSAEVPELGEEAVTVTPQITLKAASSDQGAAVVPETYDSLRAAKARDPEFPDGVKIDGRDRYDPEALASWSRNRERASK